MIYIHIRESKSYHEQELEEECISLHENIQFLNRKFDTIKDEIENQTVKYI